MTEQEKLAEVLDRHLDMQAKFVELMRGQSEHNRRMDALIERLDRMLELIDNYPMRTLERIDELREKVGGENGLRVQVRRQHDELKTLIRNWHILAAALITALSILVNALLR